MKLDRCDNKWPIHFAAIKIDDEGRCTDYVPKPEEKEPDQMTDCISREAALNAQNKSMNLREMRIRLERLPAADVAPVVHGYWITCIRHEHYPSGKEYEEDYCSVCGKRGSREDDYCPRCGARMDVEQEKYEAQKRDLENALRSMEEAITTPVVDVTRWQYPQLTEEAKKGAADRRGQV